jgi:hypothetical protein
MANISDMVGLVFTKVEGAEYGSPSVTFHAEDGRRFEFYHAQDCCERVAVEDVTGDVSDLVGSPILVATDHTSDDYGPARDDSTLWTFYDFRTNKGTVTIRWCGSSNGYYSVSVHLRVHDPLTPT